MQQDIVSKLRSFFKHIECPPAIHLVYAFGSRVSGRERPLSDYDIAVLFVEMPGRDRICELSHKMSALLMTDRIDLVVLNQAPIELRYAVVAGGKCIYETDLSLRVEFEAQTLSLYGDYLSILRKQRQDILMEKQNDTGIQRYRKALGQTERLLEEIRAVHPEVYREHCMRSFPRFAKKEE